MAGAAHEGHRCLLGVLAFHFPQYMTTPELRRAYSVDVIRQILFVSLLISGGLSLANIVLDNRRRLNGLAFLFVVAAVALGGSRVPVGDFPDHTPYIGMDWFILDLLGSTAIFVLLEKLFPLYKKQPVFRPEWQTDMVHFAVNHFIVNQAVEGIVKGENDDYYLVDFSDDIALRYKDSDPLNFKKLMVSKKECIKHGF